MENYNLYKLEGSNYNFIVNQLKTKITNKIEINNEIIPNNEKIFMKNIEYCTTCNISVSNKLHYQSEIHNYNLLLKMHHIAPITIEKYNEMNDDERNEMLSDDSSSSDDDNDDIIQNNPKIKISIENENIIFYKSLLINYNDEDKQSDDIISMFTQYKSCHFGIFMFRSGYFSAGIIEDVFL